jgi:predicted  nucleic acid-binding Zn-ribbon protein
MRWALAGRRLVAIFARRLLQSAPLGTDLLNVGQRHMSQIEQLYYLQQIDSEIRQKKQRLRDVLQAKKNNLELIEARDHFAETHAALTEVQATQRALSDELSRVNTERRRTEHRLYSGEVSNTKELADLEQKVVSLKRRQSVLEEEVLEAMYEVEAAQEDDTEAATILDELEEDWNDRLSVLQREQDKLAGEVNDLLKRRQEQASLVDGGMLHVYHKAGEKRGGLAVAGLKENMCQACGVRVSAAKARAVRNAELVYCGSCGRILHLL